MLFLEHEKKSSRNYVSLFNRARNSISLLSISLFIKYSDSDFLEIEYII